MPGAPEPPPPAHPPDLIVVMGVSGCGKTTIGRLLADRLGHAFADADDFHPPANVERMRAGQPLDDAARAPWLDALHARLLHARTSGQPLVLACSALRQRYRDRLAEQLPGLRWVHLAGTFEQVAARLAARRGHYMPATLLRSQFDTLEPPADAIIVSIDAPEAAIVAAILGQLAAPDRNPRAIP